MIPPRPNLIPEQLRDRVNELTGGTMRFNRAQSAQLLVMLAANLERMLNDDQRLPLVRCTIDKRADGFTLNAELLPLDNHTDVEL